MYYYLKGTLVAIDGEKAVVDVGGIGFSLNVGTQFHTKAPAIGKELTIFTHLVTREDSTQLFGFLSQGERDLFLDVQTVSGIGPKLALAIISHLPTSAFAQAVRTADIKTLSSIPGIGRKSAERIALELKDKMGKYASKSTATDSTHIEEAIAALIALGLPRHQATQSVQKAIQLRPDVQNVSLLLQLALSQKAVV